MSEPKSKATRYNQGKNMVGLITPKFKEGLGQALTIGATKYGRDNWRQGLKVREVLDSLNRHLLEIEKGEDIDPESGIPHWAHLAANLMFVAEFSGDPKWDDRIKENKRPKVDEIIPGCKSTTTASPFPTQKSIFTDANVDGSHVTIENVKYVGIGTKQLPYDPRSPNYAATQPINKD